MDDNFEGSPSTKPLSLRRNLYHAAFGKAVFALTQFGILATVTHLGPPEHVGAMTVASALVTPLFFLTSMGMRDVHAVDDLDRFTRADYVALRFLGGGVAVALVCLLAVTYQSSSGWLVQASTIAFAFVKFFGAQSSLNHGVFQRAERMDYVSASVLCRGIGGFAVFAVTYWSTRNLPLAIALEAAAWCATNIFDQRLLAKLDARTRWADLAAVRPAKVGRLTWWILPLGISLWLTRTAQSAPPLVLERYTDLAAVGVFGAMSYLNTSLSMMSGVLGSASAARLRRFYRNGQQRDFARLAVKLTLLSASLGATGVLIAWLAGAPLLGLLFGEGYQRVDIFVIMMLAAAISITGDPLLTAISAGQAFKRRLTISGTACAVAFGVSMLLIPVYGITGAAWSQVAITSANLLLTMLSFRAVSAGMPGQAPGGSTDSATPDGA